MESFRAQSSLCLRLASQGTDSCEWFQLRTVLEPIANLLATEARVQKVFVMMSGPQDLWIHADRRRLEQGVLRLFLEGLSAGAGSVLKVDVFSCHDALSLGIGFTARSDSKVHASYKTLLVSAQGAITIVSGNQNL